MKRNITFILCMILALQTISCGADTTVPDETVSTQAAEEVQETEPAFRGVTKADMNGRNFTAYTEGWYDYAPLAIDDIVVEELTGDSLNDAVYDRNMLIETDLNCKVVHASFPDTNHLNELANSIAAGDNAYDFCLIRGFNFLTSVTSGYLLDMADLPGVDYSQPYWNQTVMNIMSIVGKQYGAPSGVTVNDEKSVCCMYFNKEMASDYSLPNLYTLVNDGDWTYSRMFEMAELAAADLNGDGKYTHEDQYGISHIRDSVSGILASAEIMIAQKDENDLPYYAFPTEQNITRYLDIFSKLFEQDICYNYHQRLGAETEQTMFVEEQILFCMGGIYYAPSMRVMDCEFGILPFPKYDENQNTYTSTMDPGFMTLTCIPVSNSSLEETGIFLEYYAWLGHSMILPAFYDVLLTGKIVRDEESVRMLDLIFDSLIQDMGGTFNFGGFHRELLMVCDRYTLDIASLSASYQQKVETDIQKLIDALKES